MEPFARDMVRDHARFAGRWAELQHICTALDRRTPALVLGPRQSGRSSLLYHVVHAAPALFDQPHMQSFYIDLNECADVDILRASIATALHLPPARWQVGLADMIAAPLLAFDNCDTPHLTVAMASWWDELLPMVRAGTLRVLAAGVHRDTTLMPWQVVPMQRVDGSMLDDIVSAQLGDDGPRLSRPDQTWMLQQSRGHIGVLMAYLRAWYRAQTSPGTDWRAMVLHIPVTTEALASAEIVTALASEWYVGDAQAETATMPSVPAQLPPTDTVAVVEMPRVLWVIGVLCLVILVWKLWQGGN